MSPADFGQFHSRNSITFADKADELDFVDFADELGVACLELRLPEDPHPCVGQPYFIRLFHSLIK